MRCHYLSDLHLESQEAPGLTQRGDVLLIAGDLCNAAALSPRRRDPYAVAQRSRVLGFIDDALSRFEHVLLVAGNHEHYEGVFEDTVPLLREQLPGVVVLDDESVDLGGQRFFGSTLWSDFEGGTLESMTAARRGVGDFLLVKRRVKDGGHETGLEPFQPEHARAAFLSALDALRSALETAGERNTIVVTHHAPSRKSLNPLFMGNGLDGAFASTLDGFISQLQTVPFWVHGHTHVQRRYTIGQTTILANCLGLPGKGRASGNFSTRKSFEI
ncbi:MAG: metallophosphoesterase [Hyphomicrobiaceae bacterium]